MAAYMIETFVTLLGVIGVAIAVLYGARRLGIGRALGPMELVGRLPLDGRRAVYLVRVADQVLVIGVSEAGLTKLGEMPADKIPAAEPTGQMGFGEVLARVRAMGARARSQEQTTEKRDE